MKLQTKYNRATISAAVFVLIVGSISYYFLLRYVLIKEVDDALRVEEQEIIDYVRVHHKLPQASHYHDQQIQFSPAVLLDKRRFISERVRSSETGEMEISRKLIFPVKIDGKNYTAVVTKSEEETEGMILFIALLTVVVILLLFILLYIANRRLFKKIWEPFYATLSTMKRFNLSHPDKINLPRNEVDEFNDLNKAVNEMTMKVADDYQSLKTFADNASHEMQTPLAVINSKLDLLIQDQALSAKNMHDLQSIYDSVTKLSRLNQSLLLMAKIENHQFHETKNMCVNQMVHERLQYFEELIQSKHLRVSTSLRQCEVLMNPLLADILLNNLLTNAIRHNVQAGSIEIESTSNFISISNHSGTGLLEEKTIFSRFQKSQGSEGLGIGLAIVKQICDLYGFQVGYSFRKQMHEFQVKF